ncbi:MAG: chain-length determining protein [Deltaproteobacteria bacterium]|nr:chain-length determining protein [Deltaproteobacteria bacterium]TLN03603.1 MAG: chain-length determining protein [bacterium]
MSSEFNYKQYLSLLKKWKYPAIIAALLVMTGAVALSYLLPKKYEAQSVVFIEKSIISDMLKGLAVSPTVEDKIKVLTYALNSRTLILKVIDDLDLNVRKQGDAHLEEMVKEFQKNVNIKVKDKEGLFIISYSDTDPRLARDYVNNLVRRYIEENVSSKREESYGATTFMDEQIKTFREKMEKADAAVNDYRRQKGAELAQEGGNVLVDISTSQQRLDEIRSRRAQLEAQRTMLRTNDPSRARLAAMEKRLNELRTEFTDSYPEVIKLKSDIATIREQMHNRPKGAALAGGESEELQRINIELQGLRESEAIQRSTLGSSRGLLQQMPAVRAELERLERERDTQKAFYEQLVTRQGQSEISKQLEVQDKATTFRIIDPAVAPNRPVSPDRVKMIMMGILAGLAAGFGICLLLDKMDNSVKSVDALKVFGLPVLAAIPSIRDPQVQALKQKKDIRVFIAAGAYFCLILMVLAYEVVDRYLL